MPWPWMEGNTFQMTIAMPAEMFAFALSFSCDQQLLHPPSFHQERYTNSPLPVPGKNVSFCITSIWKGSTGKGSSSPTPGSTLHDSESHQNLHKAKWLHNHKELQPLGSDFPLLSRRKWQEMWFLGAHTATQRWKEHSCTQDFI